MGVPTYANGNLILPGHWLKVLVETPVGRLWHHGLVRRIVATGYGDYYIEIIHNVKDGGVIVSSLAEFSNGAYVFFVRQPASPEHSRLILATAEANLGKPYSLFSQNCEHFCWFCYTWEPKSETLEAWGWVGATAMLVVAAWHSDFR